jgi:hypothetical protein
MLRLSSFFVSLGLFVAGPAAATTFSFHCISGDGGGACAIPIGELWVDVSDDGLADGQVAFTFHNESLVHHPPIGALYFEDTAGLLAGYVSVIDGDGVDFEPGGSPRDLPSGTVEGFTADWIFSAENPKPRHGVGPGEEVTIVFALADGVSYADLIAAMQAGGVRVGLHAPPFGDHGNKSFVTGGDDPSIPTPEPGAWALLACALATGLAARRGRRALR